ncbi:MAG: GNAT family N-acetyltransferase [Flavobacterium sp.]|nr:GNAT family N-acetyltransferase [Flavobacterium sp.]
MVNISEASVNDIIAIRNIAYQTWPKVYADIITQAQITYMLDLFYSESALLESIINKKHEFLLVKEQNVAIGFAGFEHGFLQEKVTRLHKLYLLPAAHGKGLGKLLLKAVAAKSKENFSTIMSLNVNKYNPTIAFYKKMGFEIVGEEKLAIGNDYFMDDYKMELKLT